MTDKRSRSRNVVVAVIAAAAMLIGIVWWTSSAPTAAEVEAPSNKPSNKPSSPLAAKLRSVPLPSAPSPRPSIVKPVVMPDLSRFPELPPAHRADAVKAALDGYAEWLRSEFPTADAVFLGADCSASPCLIGMSFSPTVFAEKASTRAFLKGTQGEVEQRVGFPIDAVHVDEDTKGRQYLWMYGLPREFSAEDHSVLRGRAVSRHAAKLDPIRPPIEPAVPGPGEPGY